MSAQYWARKLQGGYVYHDNKYKKVTDLRVQLPDDERPNFLYPEDYLPYITFRLDDGDDWIKYEDFEIRFPEEQYIKHDGKAVWGGRNMKRAWLVVPSNESWEIREGVTMSDWLNPEPFQFDLPDRFLHWGEDAVFNPTMMAKDETNEVRYLYACNLPTLKATRTLDSVTITQLRGDLPEWIMLWGDLEEPIPYVWPEGEDKPGEGYALALEETFYHWGNREPGGGWDDDFQYQVHMRHMPARIRPRRLFEEAPAPAPVARNQSYLLVQVHEFDGDAYQINTAEDAEAIWGAHGVAADKEILNDVKILLAREGIPL